MKHITLRKRFAVVISIVIFLFCTAESCTSGGGVCDVTGNNTMITTCAYQVVTGK